MQVTETELDPGTSAVAQAKRRTIRLSEESPGRSAGRAWERATSAFRRRRPLRGRAVRRWLVLVAQITWLLDSSWHNRKLYPAFT